MSKAKLSKTAQCTNRQGNLNISTGDQWKACVKKICPELEAVRHGKNPNNGTFTEKLEFTETTILKIENLIRG
jgi:hypothetical protein